MCVRKKDYQLSFSILNFSKIFCKLTRIWYYYNKIWKFNNLPKNYNIEIIYLISSSMFLIVNINLFSWYHISLPSLTHNLSLRPYLLLQVTISRTINTDVKPVYDIKSTHLNTFDAFKDNLSNKIWAWFDLH